jgi:hypothetical protein
MDEDAVLDEADRVGRRIWNRVQAESPVRVPRLPRPV